MTGRHHLLKISYIRTKWSPIAAFVFGIIFVTSLIVLAMKFPEPTTFQYEIFKDVMALAGAGVASVIPGVINLRMHGFVRAGGAIAVFVLMYLKSPAQLVAVPSTEDTGPAYRVGETFYIVDLTERRPTGTHRLTEPFSKATVERRDRIRKVSSKKEDFELYFGTSGLRIDWESVISPARSEYRELEGKRFRTRLTKSYSYILHLADRERTDDLEVVNRFIFWNAFQGEKAEWWSAEIKYPTDKAIIVFAFPKEKPCKQMRVQIQSGDGDPVEQSRNLPIIVRGGAYAYWTGDHLSGGQKYLFEFAW